MRNFKTLTIGPNEATESIFSPEIVLFDRVFINIINTFFIVCAININNV